MRTLNLTILVATSDFKNRPVFTGKYRSVKLSYHLLLVGGRLVDKATILKGMKIKLVNNNYELLVAPANLVILGQVRLGFK